MRINLLFTTLKMAISQRAYKEDMLIHHSDRGIQYCCDEYQKILFKSIRPTKYVLILITSVVSFVAMKNIQAKCERMLSIDSRLVA